MIKIFALVLLILFTSCHKSQTVNYESGVSADDKTTEQEVVLQLPVGEASPQTDGDNSSINEASKKIVRTGELSFETDNPGETRKVINNAIKANKGYISSDKESGSDSKQKEYILTIRVPASNFDNLLNNISSSVGKIMNKNISRDDVTFRYIDRETRLRNMKKLEKRYVELMNKASKVADMLQIEAKLSETRNEIETAEREFKYLQQQISYSSLTVTYYTESVSVEDQTSFLTSFKDSLAVGFQTLRNTFFTIISLWPFVLLAGIVCFIYLERRKKNKRKH